MIKPFVQKLFLITSDVLALFFSLVLASLTLSIFRPEFNPVSFSTLGIAKLGGLLLVIIFWYQEQYTKRRPVWEEVRLIFLTIIVFSIFHLGASYVVSHHVVKTINVLFWLYLIFLLPLLRYVTKMFLYTLNLWQRELYIIGLGDNALSTYRLLSANKVLGYNFLGFVDLKDSKVDELSMIEVDGRSLQIFNKENLLEKKVSDTEIIFALSSGELLESSKLINVMQTKYTYISIVPDIVGLPLYGVELNHFFGSEHLFLRLRNNLGRRFNRVIKRVSDIILSSLAILILSPFLLIIGLLIRLSTSTNQIFFMHKRIGINGALFNCIKFKTMYDNSQEILVNLLANNEELKREWERDFKLRDDPRITPIGKFLRKSSLDELPQLFNVLKGEMSLVGPRPIIDEELNRYGEDAYYYKLVRPGITGLWQISGRNDIDYKTRVRLDVYYVKNWSLWYDVVILLKTVFVILTKKGAY